MDEWKFAMRETELLVKYVKEHEEVTDILFTGGDPLIMKAKKYWRFLHQNTMVVIQILVFLNCFQMKQL